jgi:hypothetical protein
LNCQRQLKLNADCDWLLVYGVNTPYPAAGRYPIIPEAASRQNNLNIEKRKSNQRKIK